MKKKPLINLISPVENIFPIFQQKPIPRQGLMVRNDVEVSLILMSLPGIVCWKNEFSQYLGGNDNFLELAELSHENELIGRTDFTLPWVNSAKELIRDDKYTLGLARNATYSSVNTLQICKSFGYKNIVLNTLRKHLFVNQQSIIIIVAIQQ